MPVVAMMQKYMNYNVGDKVSVDDALAHKWCDVMHIAVVVPPDVPAKAPMAPQVDKMVGVAEQAKGADSMPGKGKK